MLSNCEITSQGDIRQGLETRFADDPENPLMLSFPHSGDVYPDDFGYDPALPFNIIDFPSDKYVDELFGEGEALGLASIKANFPRAYVDVNRHQHDIDGTMLEDSEGWYGRLQPTVLKAGATLFWSHSRENPIYARKLGLREAKGRLANYFIPYHQAMTAMVERARAKFGSVYIVDCHSMTQFDSAWRGGKERPEIDIGTRHGESCAPDLAEVMAWAWQSRGYDVGVDRRFAGGEITLRYGWPEIGQHIMQVEIRRDLYMDEDTRERKSSFAKVQSDCTAVLREFKDYIDQRKNADHAASI